MNWLPGHITHVLIAGIYAITSMGITGLEVYTLKSLNSVQFFFLVVQNVGIMGTSGYFASKITVSEKGLSETNKA